MTIQQQVVDDMREAMVNQKPVEINALKSLLARFSSAETVGVEVDLIDDKNTAETIEGMGSTDRPRRILTIDEERAVIEAEVDELRQALSYFGETSDKWRELKLQIEVLSRYL